MNIEDDNYRIQARLLGCDSPIDYFIVSIRTKDRKCWLRNVIHGAMRLSHIGQIVAEEWEKMATTRNDVVLDEWVIMPNHLHGIIGIVDRDDLAPAAGQRNKLSSLSLLSTLVKRFKDASTERVLNAGYEFGWQSRYNEEIIRGEASLQAAREYIRYNPIKWEMDGDNPLNYGRDVLRCISLMDV